MNVSEVGDIGGRIIMGVGIVAAVLVLAALLMAFGRKRK